MSQQLKIACLTPAALIGMCHPAILLLTASSGLLRGPVQSGPPGEVWHGSPGELPRHVLISKSKSGPCELFIQQTAAVPLCRVRSDSDTEFRTTRERLMNNHHVMC